MHFIPPSETVSSNDKVAIDDGERESMMIKFREEIERFVADKEERTLTFPPSLLGNERKIVHEVIELM